jgi:hypothetical protein
VATLTARILELHDGGATVRQIVDRLGCRRGYVGTVLGRHNRKSTGRPGRPKKALQIAITEGKKEAAPGGFGERSGSR